MRDLLEQVRLRDLVLLEHVHVLGTLKQAAEAMHVTQPAVTQILKGIEQAFGLPLVERGRRGVRLNAAGEAALVRLRCARQELEQARSAAHSSLRPTLHVGATPIATLHLLPQVVRRMRQRLPQVRLALAETGVESLWQQLAEGRLDALVGRLPSKDPRFLNTHDLVHQLVGSERMVLACGPAHPLARQGAAASGSRKWLQALAASDWILPPGETPVVQACNEWFAQAGELPPVPVIVSGSFYASLNLAARSDLLTIVPESAASTMRAALNLTILNAPWRNPAVGIVFAARASNWQTDAIVAMRACFSD